MQSSELPEDVREFLRHRIVSFEQLEVLLLLRRERAGRWDVASLSARLRISETLIVTALGGLVASGLVRPWPQDEPAQYLYGVENEHLDATIGSLETTYRKQPIQIIRQMSGDAIERVRNSALRIFADAFIVRRDKNRG